MQWYNGKYCCLFLLQFKQWRKEDYRLLLDSITVLEGLVGKYHSSLAALGKQRLGVTRQPPFGDWGAAATPERR